eukprot:Partr_v1_DN26672_c0_g1_i4_m69075 putative casein kinase ii
MDNAHGFDRSGAISSAYAAGTVDTSISSTAARPLLHPFYAHPHSSTSTSTASTEEGSNEGGDNDNGSQDSSPDSQDLQNASHDDGGDTGDEDDDNAGLTWVEWFCSLPGHEFFCEVDDEFIDDDFNLTGLSTIIPYFSEALEMIQDIGPEGAYSKADLQVIEASAEMLYALIHQRFILSRQGSAILYEKFASKMYGQCPRALCEGQPVLPVGLSDAPSKHTVKLFCPRCVDIYHPPSSRHQSLDGCAFGITAPFLLIYSYNDIREQMKREWWPRSVTDTFNAETRIQESGIYTPRIFNFKIHESSPTGSKMKWLRQKKLED